MNQTTYRMRRRVGAALLAGVSALGVAGVAALAGGGVASASTPLVTASLASSAATIPGTGTNTVSSGINLTLSGGSITAGDEITLTLACPSTGAIGWSAATTTALDWTVQPFTDNGSCTVNGVTEPNVLTLKASASGAATTINITGISYVEDGMPPGAVSISGAYLTLGAASTAFSVPSNATISWFGATSNVPPVTVTSGSAQSVSNITITQPAGLNVLTGTSNTLNVTLSNATFSAAPSFSAVPANSVATPAPTVSLTTSSEATVTFTVQSTQATNFTFSNVSITPTGAGQVVAKVSFTPGSTSTYSSGAPQDVSLSLPVASFQGPSNRIYGQSADETVAQEFEAAFPLGGGGKSTAVLATDVDPYDALSAAYLESQLGTGLLITSPTQFTGSAAATAMRLEGVSTVYVVGGPDAITPAVISQIENTPAYNAGGVTTTGSNLKVVGPIYGNTADDTAQSIATYFGTAYGSLPAVPNAYTSAGGLYNDTTGNASATGPSGASTTVFVISDKDWQDATTLGPISYAYRIPIVLTQAGQATLGIQATNALTTLKPSQVIVVGGQLAFPNSVVTQIQGLNGGTSVLRIAGQDYTDTAAELAKFELSSTTGAGLSWSTQTHAAGYLLSHGDYWSDALGAAALGGQSDVTLNGTAYNNEPILTTKNPTTIGSYLQTYLGSVAPSTAGVNVLGGPLAITDTVVSSVKATLAS